MADDSEVDGPREKSLRQAFFVTDSAGHEVGGVDGVDLGVKRRVRDWPDHLADTWSTGSGQTHSLGGHFASTTERNKADTCRKTTSLSSWCMTRGCEEQYLAGDADADAISAGRPIKTLRKRSCRRTFCVFILRKVSTQWTHDGLRSAKGRGTAATPVPGRLPRIMQ